MKIRKIKSKDHAGASTYVNIDENGSVCWTHDPTSGTVMAEGIALALIHASNVQHHHNAAMWVNAFRKLFKYGARPILNAAIPQVGYLPDR